MALLTSLWFVSFAVGFIGVLVFSLVRWTCRKRSLQLKPEGTVLLITAHPDDECMFFAPTIISLTQANVEVFLLCLSEGNYYGQGHIRRRELLKSAAVLGIEEDHVRTINDRDLPDDPAVEWQEDIVGNYIVDAVRRLGIKTIITFDEKGVSLHPNHVAISKAVKMLCNKKSLHSEVYLLETVNIWRKYCGLLDIGWTMLLTKASLWVNLDWTGYLKAQVDADAQKSVPLVPETLCRLFKIHDHQLFQKTVKCSSSTTDFPQLSAQA